MTFPRQTLAADVAIEGKGLHTGVPVTLTLRPAEDGIHFRVGSARIPARPESVTDTTRSTRLGDAGTVEHVMSALAGMGVTDVEVELTAPECPGLDGSARPLVELIRSAGLAPLGERTLRDPFSRTFVQEDGGVKVAIGKGAGHWRYLYDLGDRWPGAQAYETEDVSADYADQVAPARTFALYEEMPMIVEAGLGKGLDATSALVLGATDYANPPRFADEPARHKLLDLIGDLYLCGIPPQFLNVVAERSGHRSNVAAAHRLALALAGPGASL